MACWNNSKSRLRTSRYDFLHTRRDHMFINFSWTIVLTFDLPDKNPDSIRIFPWHFLLVHLTRCTRSWNPANRLAISHSESLPHKFPNGLANESLSQTRELSSKRHWWQRMHCAQDIMFLTLSRQTEDWKRSRGITYRAMAMAPPFVKWSVFQSLSGPVCSEVYSESPDVAIWHNLSVRANRRHDPHLVRRLIRYSR